MSTNSTHNNLTGDYKLMAANFEIVKDTLKKYKGKGIANIEIPEGVKVIGQDVFWGCKEIQRIKIPEGLTEIGQEAFLE